MNKQQPEALRVADDLVSLHAYPLSIRAAAELRRQHAEIEALISENETLRTVLADIGKSLL